MSHFGDFMDGVPVKISEKYKKPPKIELPYSVIECPIRAQSVVENVRYSSDFERSVLAKLKELRSIKETKKNERRHRLQLLEEAKQKKLDAIAAAEEDERLKQLSVSEVSYPSTEEISALSPDEKVDKNCNTNVDNTPESIQENVSTDVNILPSCTTNEPQLNILQPIQVKSNYEGSLLDDPDPLETLKMNMKINKIHYNHNVDKLTFQDFENDTSSPFDNVELKTINDMELLAQVLQSQRESATSCHPQSYIQDQTCVIPNCASQAQMEMPYVQHTYLEQPIQGPSVMCSPQNYTDGYYVRDDDNVYASNYQYYLPTNPYNVDPNYYSNQLSSTVAETSQVSNGSQYIPQPYYYQYQRPVQYQPENTEYIQNDIEQPLVTSQNNVKSRSRSVPDIVQELNEELEKLKTSERSYNASPALEVVPQPSSSTEKKAQRRRRKSEQRLPDPYNKLAPTSQKICQMIHSMGFPIDRVARVCTIVGDNDKKIIECLLILGEMMDLGFSESKVSEALVKHKFNRDKVLDELVS